MIKQCVICGKEFEARDRANSGRRMRNLRKSNAVTCSRKCSVENQYKQYKQYLKYYQNLKCKIKN